MQITILNLIEKNATWKKILIFLALTLILSTLLMLYILPQFRIYSHGIDPLDTNVGYNVAQAEEFLTSTPTEALQYYLRCFFPLDLVYPIVSAIFLSLIISALFQRLLSAENKLRLLIIAPFVTACCDYLENFGIFHMILSLPGFHPKVAFLTSIFSSLKWYLGFAVLALISFSSILFFLNWTFNTDKLNRKT